MAARDLYPTSAQLNRRVEVWGKIETKNEIGQTAYTDTQLKTVWAQIVSQSGSITWQQTETVLTNATHKFVMRYRAAFDIVVGYWLKYNGKRYDVQYVQNVNEANWMIELYCLEVQDT